MTDTSSGRNTPPPGYQTTGQTARLHDVPNGAALKKTLERMAREYQKVEYLNIANISVSRIYNLKKASYLRSIKSTRNP